MPGVVCSAIAIHTRVEDDERDEDDEDWEPGYEQDLITPLGNKLPKDMHAARARRLADQLTPALDRLHELLDLLKRRGQGGLAAQSGGLLSLSGRFPTGRPYGRLLLQLHRASLASQDGDHVGWQRRYPIVLILA